MIKRYSNKHYRYGAVRGVLISDRENLIHLPDYERREQIFLDSIHQIDAMLVQKSYSKSAGMFKARKIRAEIYQLCPLISHKLVLLAKSMGKTHLLADVECPIWKLKRMRVIMLQAHCTKVHERGMKYLEEAAAFTLQREELDRLKELSDQLLDGSIAFRLRQSTDRNETSLLLKLFEKADAALEDLFEIFELMQLSGENTSLYKTLMRERYITKYHTRRIALKGNVVCANTGEPLPNARWAIYAIDSEGNRVQEKPLKQRRTAPKGGFVVQNLAKGLYELEVRKFGYLPLKQSFLVQARQTTQLPIQLMPE